MIISHNNNKELRRLYHVWRQMVARCADSKHVRWAGYGGRGITVCEAWLDFEAFYIDMAPRPLGLTLERIDNDKGYDALNCRWATYTDQRNNRRLAARPVRASSSFRGVYWCRARRKWRAQLKRAKHQMYLGHFDTEQEAARVYEAAAVAYARSKREAS